MALSKDFLAELKSRMEITEVISRYVRLKNAGHNMVGLCPFHNEKTPSFTVFTGTQNYFCFGCGAGGDTITFIRQAEHLDYMDAVKLLAGQAGLTVPEEGQVDDTLSKLRMRVLEANREAARFFHHNLYTPEGRYGLDYFLQRGLSENTIRRFGLGVSLKTWDSLTYYLREKGFRDTELIAANLAGKNRYDKLYDFFRERAMFPIIDTRGNVIAFGGRALGDNERKYMNSSDTPAFHKSESLFAMNFAKNNDGTLILAEGFMDVIALHQAGFTNSVATLGTAITKEQVKMMSRYTGTVTVMYDADNAGQKATARAIPLLREAGLKIRILRIPDGKDPDEFLKTHGENGIIRLRQLLQKADNDLEYQLDILRSQHILTTSDGKLEFMRSACKLLAGVDSPAERELYTVQIASDIGIDKTTLKEEVDSLRKKNYRAQKQKEVRMVESSVISNDALNPEKRSHPRAAAAEEGIIAYLFQNQESAKHIVDELPTAKFITAFNRRVYDVLLTQIINSSEPIDLSDILTEFSIEECGRVTGIIYKHVLPAERDRQHQALRDYITVLREENILAAKPVTDEDYLLHLALIKDKKCK